ncbi:ER-derived vesicles protein ERV14 [Protomyces lactucae-debilis]|uniref:ER-derived vesicles protein ERV14 n=1 Tax=Protomyces lactucae-debilis TaxID=2754530 RepID=A0A1Y2FDF2_PROLT|nr:ER-derived vesicles protein ERV14 [Protomyces lactucae-debilis]ORY81949.1 ER-derived vesicles protein ERV14 [Protomyces lactucae-debilis]
MGVWTFVLALLLDLVLLAHAVYETVLLSDVSADFLNPVDAVNKINPYVLPSMAIQGFLTFLMLVTGNWWSFLFNLPLAVWNGSKVLSKDYALDATEIFRTLNRNQMQCYIRLASYMLFFFW